MQFHTLYRSMTIIPWLLANNHATRRILTIGQKKLDAAGDLLAIPLV